MIVITLPLPPTLNNLYYNTDSGRKLTPQGKKYKQKVFEILFRHGSRGRFPEPPIEMELWAMLPDRRIRDVGNILKVVEDAVAEFMGYNDSLNHIITLYKCMDRINPRCVLRYQKKSRRIPDPPDLEYAEVLKDDGQSYLVPSGYKFDSFME